MLQVWVYLRAFQIRGAKWSRDGLKAHGSSKHLIKPDLKTWPIPTTPMAGMLCLSAAITQRQERQFDTWPKRSVLTPSMQAHDRLRDCRDRWQCFGFIYTNPLIGNEASHSQTCG